MSEQSIEKEIQDKNLNAPRLTPELIDKKIKSVVYHVFGETSLTVCCMTLANGFTVTGESACASPENFNKEIGEKIAFDQARNKIWMLEGYLLKDNLFNNQLKNIKKYLEEVAYIGESDIPEDDENVYYSKFDKSYITRVGMERNINFLYEKGITSELTHGVGFSPKENKWYGWSHRAIFGFEIGSTCKKGDCHYHAANENDEIEAAINFWSGDNKIKLTAKKIKDGVILVEWTYDDETPNESLRGQVNSNEWGYDVNFGRGEWTAKTMEDAKQMAIDFNEGVS